MKEDVFFSVLHQHQLLTQRIKCNINLIKTFSLVTMHAAFRYIQTCLRDSGCYVCMAKYSIII